MKVGFSGRGLFFFPLCSCSFLLSSSLLQAYSSSILFLILSLPHPRWFPTFDCACCGEIHVEVSFLALQRQSISVSQSTSAQRRDQITKSRVHLRGVLKCAASIRWCVIVCAPCLSVFVCVCFKSTVRLLLPIILCNERNRVFESKGLPW